MSRHADRQAVAREFGATDIIEERGEDAIVALRALLDGDLADAALECVGTKESMEQALGSVRGGGRVGFVGVPAGGPELDIRELFDRNITVGGGMAPARTYIPQLLPEVLSGAMQPGKVFDLELPLAEVAEAYAAMDERRAIKVLLRPLEAPKSPPKSPPPKSPPPTRSHRTRRPRRRRCPRRCVRSAVASRIAPAVGRGAGTAVPRQERAHERRADDVAGHGADQRARDHAAESGTAVGGVRERALERAGLAHLCAGRRAGQGGGFARERSLAGAGALAQLFVDDRALLVGQLGEGLGVHLLDRLGRGGAQQVAVPLDGARVIVGRFVPLRRRGWRGFFRSEQTIQESHVQCASDRSR